ncbi:MAG: phosphotransferase [Chloroflexi bacterium]|nr:phosphotransferase [Chloroflexota bacterium]
MDEAEQPLTGGNASASVVRVGGTVRKPWAASTPAVHELLEALRSAGVDVPAPQGRDSVGRQVLEYVPGRLAMWSPRLTSADLARVGRLVRRIHDASEDPELTAEPRWDVAIPTPDADLICHNDLAPWNLILGERWVFIDWDGAGPSTRLWDLAYAAQTFTLGDADEAPDVAAVRLAAFVDGYRAGPDLREALPAVMAARALAMYELLRTSDLAGREPWGSMYRDGHGQHWERVAGYVARHADVWREALIQQATDR